MASLGDAPRRPITIPARGEAQAPPSARFDSSLAILSSPGSSMETPIVISPSDSEDASHAKLFDKSILEHSPSPSPRTTAKGESGEIMCYSQDFADFGLEIEDISMQHAVEECQETNELPKDTEQPKISDTPQSLLQTPSYIRGSKDGRTRSSRSPSATSGPLPIWMIENNIKKLIRRQPTPTDRGEGWVYIFADPHSEAGFFKIGRSTTPRTRTERQRATCYESFDIVDQSPRDEGINWFLRLESLVHAELFNVTWSEDCPCKRPHHEYFAGTKSEAREVLGRWAQWLKSKPYDGEFQLSPFWLNRLRLLADDKLDHARCSRPECSSAKDLRASSCQTCLRLRLAAWTEVTDLDYIKFECRTRVTWGSVRWLIINTSPNYPNFAFRLISYWEAVQPHADHLWGCAWTYPLYLSLFVALQIVSSSAYFVAICLLVHWRFMTCWDATAYNGQPVKEAGRVMPNPKPPSTPQPKTPFEPVTEPGASSSKKRSGGVNEPVNTSSHPDAFTTPENHEKPRGSRAATLSPSIMLTEDRATKMAGKGAKKTGGKRRKSGTDISTVI